MPPIDGEVGVRCEDHRIGKRFGHSHQTGIGEAHGYVRVFLQELKHWLRVTTQFESGNQGAAANQSGDRRQPTRTEKVEGFGQDRFANSPGRSVERPLGYRPIVVRVTAAQQSD